MGLVHLDIKPENVFITIPEPNLPNTLINISEDEYSSVGGENQPMYKIGEHCKCNHGKGVIYIKVRDV